MVGHFQGRMINIHPALLPHFGGKGMYGMHVHRAVKAAGAERSGMTVHWVTAAYDEGDVSFKLRAPVSPMMSPNRLRRK
jgi:phosphoribosylglycinamide formyltransferase-1